MALYTVLYALLVTKISEEWRVAMHDGLCWTDGVMGKGTCETLRDMMFIYEREIGATAL